MNNDDLTKLMHEAFDGAAPDPHLWNRVESAVSRKTLSRRIALGVAAAAIPATAFAAVTFLPSATPERPDVAIDPAPTASADDSVDRSSVAPIDLSPTQLAWFDGERIVLGDKAGEKIGAVEIQDVESVVALAGRLDGARQHLAVVVRYLDQDGAGQFRVDRLSWDAADRAPVAFDHASGPMFSQFDEATYSAAFAADGRLIVFGSAPTANPGLTVSTINFDGDLSVLEGRSIEVPTPATVRVADVRSDTDVYAHSEDGTVLIVNLEAGNSFATAYDRGSSWLHDENASRLLFSSNEAIWVVREFPERASMREVFLPFDAMALDPTELRLVEGPFGVTFLQRDQSVWRLDDTEWIEVGTLPLSTTGFVAGPGLARPVAPVDQSTWRADAVTNATPIDERGVGAVTVGMTLAQVREVTGQNVLISYDFDGFCFNTRIEGVEGFSMTFLPAGDDPVPAEDAVLATVESFEDRGSTGNRTREGVGPGMTVEDLLAAYPAAVESPNKYDPSSSYWDVDGEDGLGLRFNSTADGIIRSVFGGNGHRKALEGCA